MFPYKSVLMPCNAYFHGKTDFFSSVQHIVFRDVIKIKHFNTKYLLILYTNEEVGCVTDCEIVFLFSHSITLLL